MKLKFSLCLAVFCFFVCCVSPGAKQAKICQGKLETMIGADAEEVITCIKDWNFEAMEQWEKENPGVDDIIKHNRAGCGFSMGEIQEIFASEGKYRCILFLKKVGEDVASLGIIDMTGLSDLKDKNVMTQQYSIIRVVFKDNQLINFRIWPNVSQARMARKKDEGCTL